MRDLTEHEKRPSAFLVYLHIWRRSLGADQRAVASSYQDLAEGTGLSKPATPGAGRCASVASPKAQPSTKEIARRGFLAKQTSNALAASKSPALSATRKWPFGKLKIHYPGCAMHAPREFTQKSFSPTSVQFKDEISDALPRKRHQQRHLEFCTAYLLSRGSGVRISPGAPLPSCLLLVFAQPATLRKSETQSPSEKPHPA
jgi:hypothetical protein